MPSFSTMFMATGLIALAQAQSYTPPGDQTFGALYTPNGQSPVTRGQPYTVTWDDSMPQGLVTDTTTVSLVLCKGPSTNCVNEPSAIASGISAKSKSYVWNVPCSLEPASTGYGMLIIVDGSGVFRYSTQFGVLAGNCANSSTPTTTITSSSSSSSAAATITSSSRGEFSITLGDPTSTVTSKPDFSITLEPTTTPYTNSSTMTTSTRTFFTITDPGSSPTASSTTSTTARPTFSGAANKLTGGAAATLFAAALALVAL